ncbi:hypothetical protein Hanom_Chr14g01297291 [Helianthus anomalus]
MLHQSTAAIARPLHAHANQLFQSNLKSFLSSLSLEDGFPLACGKGNLKFFRVFSSLTSFCAA